MAAKAGINTLEFDKGRSIWEQVFTVFPLVVIGTKETDGADDLAPKHLAIPMSWENHFGFVCTPSHSTYQNIQREKQFTVTYMRPSQTVLASLAATPRGADGTKPITEALPTFKADHVNGVFVEDGYLFLECELHQIVDDLGKNVLIIGRIVAAKAANNAVRTSDQDDQDLLIHSPLLAYLYPGRFSEITNSSQLPLPMGFKR